MPLRRYEDQAAKQRAYRERRQQAIAAALAAKGIPGAAPVPTMPSQQRWHGLMEQARIALETVQDEMRAYWDDRTSTWQESERGEAMATHIDQLGEIVGDVATIAEEYSSPRGGHHG